MKNQKGFSLVELLVVVIIIAIVAAIAIPNLLASRRAANEASAISSLRTIHSSEVTYYSTTGGNTDYASLAEMKTTGGAGLIDDALGGATAAATAKSGYYYTLTLDTNDDGYCTSANPASSTTGTRIFVVSTPGVIYSSDSAATAATVPTCTAGVKSGAGTAIQ